MAERDPGSTAGDARQVARRDRDAIRVALLRESGRTADGARIRAP
ncbi:MAG: hypothetical protein V2I63_11875 [Pseudomonadales bacterium]|jgi:hypothetical protein|nr:hypothetical protein [Pseudomonadales bacterium]